MMLVHVQESIHLFIDYFHNMIGHSLPFKILQKLLGLFLLLISFVRKMLLQALINLLKFLLSLCLVSPEIVLLLQFVPDFKLVNKVCEETIDLFHSVSEVWLLVHILDLVAGDVHEELVGVNVLRHGQASQ